MNEELVQVVSPLLASGVDGVLVAHGVDPIPTETTVETLSEMIAVLGLASADLRGGLGVGVTHRFARITNPTPEVPEEEWIGELANQVLGRVRNQLLRYGLDAAVGTPVVLSGVGMRIMAPTAEQTALIQCRRRCGDELIQVFLELRFRDGFGLSPPSADLEVPDEGSMMLF